MANSHLLPATGSALHSVSWLLAAFPIACFSLTLVTDVAYWLTSNLLWLHFSEWLLFAGLVFGVLALLVRAVVYFGSSTRPSWLAALGGIVVLVLAIVNSFVHTADGWTAIMPYGLALSAITVVAMIVTGWFGRAGVRYV